MPVGYRARGLVLRRTKLGESDLIVTFLSDAESQIRAVAKGARKPASKLAGAVNLGNEVDLLLRPGRSLDIVSEGTLVRSRDGLSRDIERSAMAEAVLGVAEALTVEGEHDRRLFPMTAAALDAVLDAPVARLPLVGAAYVLKACAVQGYRPELGTCVRCGEPVGLSADGFVRFSMGEGGVVCGGCAAGGVGESFPAGVLLWAQTLLGIRFADLLALEEAPGQAPLGLDVLAFCRRWLELYPGVRPRALDFVLELGTYGV